MMSCHVSPHVPSHVHKQMDYVTQTSTKHAAMHASPSFHQAQTFSTEGKPNRLLVTVVIPATAAGHIVGKCRKGLKQIHDILGAYEVATSLDECQLSLWGTNSQIGDALNVLGKRLTCKQVHYPKSKKVAATSSPTAPPPTTTARPVPSASPKLCTNLPPPPLLFKCHLHLESLKFPLMSLRTFCLSKNSPRAHQFHSLPPWPLPSPWDPPPPP